MCVLSLFLSLKANICHIVNTLSVQPTHSLHTFYSSHALPQAYTLPAAYTHDSALGHVMHMAGKGHGGTAGSPPRCMPLFCPRHTSGGESTEGKGEFVSVPEGILKQQQQQQQASDLCKTPAV